MSKINENTFSKSMRLHKKKEIQALIYHGKKMKKAPLLVYYTLGDDQNLLKFGVSVPKKKMKKAVDRNRSKRVIREAFRVENKIWKDRSRQSLKLFVIYQDTTLPNYTEIRAKFVRIFEQIIQEQEKQ